jgi:serine/threonine protein kinase
MVEERTIIQPSATGSVRPGTRLNGVYEVGALIAEGGMGEVYRGFNIQTLDVVAIKMIRPEFMNNQEVFELFRREASILHTLTHEAIVRYFVFSVDPDIRRAYLAMEFVDGPSLTKRLSAGPLPPAEVRILRRRIAHALEAAHRRGIIHRDVSPDNIILPDGDVRKAKIIDFGIARALNLGDRTIIGSGFAGKYAYVSPEQLGMGSGEVTFKSDIYSFGLVLAEAARGRPLDMSGSQADVIDKRRSIPDLSDVDRSIRPLIHAMLEPQPDKRPASMAAVAEWGESARAAAARRASLAEDEAPARPSSGGRLAASVGGFIAIVSLIGVGYVFRDDLAQRIWVRAPALPGPHASVAGPSPLAEPPKPATAPTAPPVLASQTTAALPPLAPPASGPIESRPQTAALPPAEAPSAPEPSAAASSPPSASPTAQHVPTAEELVEASPPHASQALVELPPATVATPYRAELPAFSDRAGEGIRLAADALPQGLTFEDLGDGKGVIEGKPEKAGAVDARIVATNHSGRTAQMTAKLVIAERTPPQAVKPASLAPANVAGPQAAPVPEPLPEASFSKAPNAEPDHKAPQAAASPPVHEASLETPSSPADRERLFVRDYQGGDCFLLQPLAGRARAYLGIGDEFGAFKGFEEAFKRVIGQEPDLTLRLITAAECPALDLLRAGAGEASEAPRIELTDYRVGPNRPLAGRIAGLAGRRAYLLLVDNDGNAYRLEATTDRGGDAATFSVPLTPDSGSTGPLQVILAVVAKTPIPALDAFRSGPLKTLAPALAEDTRAGSASVGAEFFTFVK